MRAAACALPGRARSRGPLKESELFLLPGLLPKFGMEETFPPTEIATEALPQAVAFLVAQPELELLPGVKKISETLSREKDRSIWKPEGAWVGMATPRLAPQVLHPKVLWEQLSPLQAHSCSKGSRDGKNDSIG